VTYESHVKFMKAGRVTIRAGDRGERPDLSREQEATQAPLRGRRSFALEPPARSGTQHSQ